ncbi:MAG TPA: hypothetical protein VK427_27015 [Kofleriaceae bacterium]|nr:hypothetical protein [Kofleriaceae bacterium]
MKNLISILLLASACSASTNPDGGDDEAPDGTESATVKFLPTTMFDERADRIDFSSGEPVHTHTGDTVTLGSKECPDVYKHAYLLDEERPAFGREATPNPLAWAVQLKRKDLDATYRVRDDSGSTLLDWTQLPTPSDTVSTIDLRRDDAPALGEQEGKLTLEVRTVDDAGKETLTSVCWNHHPLAAPLEIGPALPDLEGLAAMTFAAGSPLSRLFGDTPTPVFAHTLRHHTAEAVTVEVDVAQPVATFSKRVVDDFVLDTTTTVNLFCESNGEPIPNADPLCTTSPDVPAPPDSDASGVLGGVWSAQLVDAATKLPVADCTRNASKVTCRIPGRPTGDAVKTYRLVVSAARIAELQPSATGPFGEVVVAGVTFTGKIAEFTDRCGLFVTRMIQGNEVSSCRKRDRYARIHALDRAVVEFEPFTATVAASPSAGVAANPVATPAGVAFEWNPGDADLPGPQ